MEKVPYLYKSHFDVSDNEKDKKNQAVAILPNTASVHQQYAAKYPIFGAID